MNTYGIEPFVSLCGHSLLYRLG